MGMGRGGSGEWVIGDSTEYQSGIHFIYETIERQRTEERSPEAG